MNEREVQKLKEGGFEGFVTVGELMESCRCVRDLCGVYVILRPDDGPPLFLARRAGSLDVNAEAGCQCYPIKRLQAEWVSGTSVMYIGQSVTLRKRLSLYMHFGLGRIASYKGGRAIWQLADARSLIVAWKYVSEKPRHLERRMIEEFRNAHAGKLPFANRQK